jgi:hypothetical protein
MDQLRKSGGRVDQTIKNHAEGSGGAEGNREKPICYLARIE